MTIRLAMEKVSELIEAATPTTLGGDLPNEFRHNKEASRERLPTASRSFWLEVADRARKAPYTSGRLRYVRSLDVIVHYSGQRARWERDLAVEEDHETITAALLDESQWDEANSGLLNVSAGFPDEQDVILGGVSEPLDDGGVLNVITLAIETV